MLRSFETDKPIYNDIKSVPITDALTKEKIAMIIKTINISKENGISQVKENGLRPCALNVTTPAAKSMEIGINRPKSRENGIGRNSPNVVSVQVSSPAPNRNSATPQISLPNPVNVPIRQNPSQQVVMAQQIEVVNLTTPPNSSPIVPNTNPIVPTLPQLLNLPSLPTRVPLRNRAMSMHMSQTEYMAAASRLSGRRQSICDNNPSPVNNNSPFALSQQKATASEQHPYTNGSKMSKTSQTKAKVHPDATYLPPPYITKVHHADFLQNRVPTSAQASKITQQTTLKVLTPEAVNSREYIFHPVSSHLHILSIFQFLAFNFIFVSSFIFDQHLFFVIKSKSNITYSVFLFFYLHIFL